VGEVGVAARIRSASECGVLPSASSATCAADAEAVLGLKSPDDLAIIRTPSAMRFARCTGDGVWTVFVRSAQQIAGLEGDCGRGYNSRLSASDFCIARSLFEK
jgi:hypothetical protein